MSNPLILDQPAAVTKSAIREAEARVRDVLDAVWKDHDLDAAEKFLRQSDAVEHLTALMRAEFLHGLSKDWRKQGMSREFYEWAAEKTGRDRLYVERRVRVGAMLDDADIPAVTRAALKTRSMEELILLSGPWEHEKLRPTHAQWERLLDQPDPSSLADELDRLLGRRRRSNKMTLYWLPDGTLEAWQDGQVEAIGFLKRPPEGDKSLLARAVSRVKGGARLVEK